MAEQFPFVHSTGIIKYMNNMEVHGMGGFSCARQ